MIKRNSISLREKLSVTALKRKKKLLEKNNSKEQIESMFFLIDFTIGVFSSKTLLSIPQMSSLFNVIVPRSVTGPGVNISINPFWITWSELCRQIDLQEPGERTFLLF